MNPPPYSETDFQDEKERPNKNKNKNTHEICELCLSKTYKIWTCTHCHIKTCLECRIKIKMINNKILCLSCNANVSEFDHIIIDLLELGNINKIKNLLEKNNIHHDCIFMNRTLIEWSVYKHPRDLHKVKCLVENLKCSPIIRYEYNYNSNSNISSGISHYLQRKQEEINNRDMCFIL
jgi:hypothetical protein